MTVTPNALLDLAPGIGQVASMRRYQVLDPDLHVLGDIHPLRASNISCNGSGSIKRRLNGIQLGASDLRNIDLFRERIRPLWVLEDGTEWPMGVYVFTAAAVNRGTYASTLGATLYDQDFILDQATRASFGLDPGGSVLNAIERLLSQVNISHYSIPVSSSRVVADPVNWPSGTSRLKILRELCDLAGWLPPFFDNNGVLVIKPPPDIVRDLPDHTYRSNRVKRKSLVENDNLLNAPNVYIVICNGPSGGDISAAAQVDPALPFSVENRGFEVTSVTRVQGLTSSTQAQQMANTLAAGGAKGYKNVRFEGTPDPRHDVFQTIEWEASIYRELSWDLKLRPGGPMSHVLTLGGFPRG